MPPSRARRAVLRSSDADARRAAILAAARHVFAANGFGDTTIDEIAQAAGIAKGTVYLYFRSKRELYRAALTSGISELTSIVAVRVAEARTLEQKVRAYVEARAGYFDTHREFFKLYLAELAEVFRHPGRRPGSAFERLYLEHVSGLEQALLESVPARGRAQRPARALAFALADLTRGIAVRQLRGWSRMALADEVEFVAGLVLKGLRKP
jgi:AcrR family transcriptional regulator